MKPKLSICIPTYNRVEFLEKAVNSIVSQITEDKRELVEIVVSDNSTNDETKAAIDKIKGATRATINYFRNKTNVGADRNILLVVERAQGQYVWLLGDDDLLVADALRKVLRQVAASQEVDVFLGDKEDFYFETTHQMKPRPILNLKQEKIFNFKQQPLSDYFKVAKKMISFFNFISVLVFKRERWQRVKGKEPLVGSEYLHMYIMMSILFSGERGVLKYLPDKIVKRRWGSDRIPDVEAKVRSDVNSVYIVAKKVFNEQRYVRGIINLLIKNDGFSWAVRAKINKGKEFYTRIFPFLFKHFWSYSLFWLKIVPLLFVPGVILRLMRNTYRKLVKGEPLGFKDMFEG